MSKLKDIPTFETGEQAVARMAQFDPRPATHFSCGVQPKPSGKLFGYLILHAGEDDAIWMPFSERQLDKMIAALEKVRSDVYGAGGS